MDFSIRADQSELLDQPNIPAADIERNMHELAIINQQLGGHQITWKGFSKLSKNTEEIHVCEMGCGGGDNLRAIERRTGNRFSRMSFTGIDINPDCIRVAEKIKWKKTTRLLVSDYRNVRFTTKPDILFCSLFCHHFKENELIPMFRWMHENSRLGFFINDLHRHPLAYYSIRLLTGLFSRSYLVKHDGPLSVLRGFKKKELQYLLDKAGMKNYTITWEWAFRWLVIVKP